MTVYGFLAALEDWKKAGRRLAPTADFPTCFIIRCFLTFVNAILVEAKACNAQKARAVQYREVFYYGRYVIGSIGSPSFFMAKYRLLPSSL